MFSEGFTINFRSLGGLYSIQAVPGCKVINVFCKIAIAEGQVSLLFQELPSAVLILELFSNRTQTLIFKDSMKKCSLRTVPTEYKGFCAR